MFLHSRHTSPGAKGETMSQRVKVKIRPGGSLRFPAICVNCSRPANEKLRLRKRIGRTTRLQDVPLCTECFQETRRLSGEEERLIRLGRLAGGLSAVVTATIALIVLAGVLPLPIALIPALVFGGLAAAGILALFRRRTADAARPEKRAIQASAAMADFSWRATTFDFENESFASRFSELNREALMEA
jgi:hypothetical protein